MLRSAEFFRVNAQEPYRWPPWVPAISVDLAQLDRDFRAALYSKRVRRAALVHRYFQEAARPQDGKRLAGRSLRVSLGELADFLAADQDLDLSARSRQLRDVFGREIGHQVSEMVHPQDHAFDGVVRSLGFGQAETGEIAHLFSKAGCLARLRQPRRRRREDVTPVESIVDGAEKEVVRGD